MLKLKEYFSVFPTERRRLQLRCRGHVISQQLRAALQEVCLSQSNTILCSWMGRRLQCNVCLLSDGVLARVPPPDQQGSAELSEDSRTAELQSVGSLKVTIQQSSESREFGQTDRTADRQTGGLHCHVCNLTCRSLQVFHEHMSGAEHVKKLQEITHSICLNTHTLQDSPVLLSSSRGRQPDARRWCDTCQTHFSGDVIIHRRTKQHKMCKQLCRPFCPVCKRHFRTPRKFVEHMKSPEHKQQVSRGRHGAQEEELITVDAVGCFEGEEEEEEEEEEEADVANDEEDEDDVGKEASVSVSTGSSFVVPVSGFLCRLCNKFFHRETTALHTHCRTRTHYLHLYTQLSVCCFVFQSHRAQRTNSEGRTRREEDTPAPT
uniref:C2H2-type domain-containing protein n=1 Tax=Lates calcarifer TaxID=8187 RepID=A0A4W6FN32_LATCA